MGEGVPAGEEEGVEEREVICAERSVFHRSQLFSPSERERRKAGETHCSHLCGETGRHPQRTALSARRSSYFPHTACVGGWRRTGRTCDCWCGSARVQRGWRAGCGGRGTWRGSRRERRGGARRSERREGRDGRPVCRSRTTLCSVVARPAVDGRARRELADCLLGQHRRGLVDPCLSFCRSNSSSIGRRLCQGRPSPPARVETR